MYFQFYIKVILPGTKAIISGGKFKKITSFKNYYLNGSQSRDLAFHPKNDQKLSYKWSCRSILDLNNSFCNNVYSDRLVEIPGNSLIVGKTYNFTLHVYSLYNEHKTWQEITPTDEDVLDVIIECVKNCGPNPTNTKEFFHIKMLCKNCLETEKLIFEWKMIKPELKTIKNTDRLIFEPNYFKDHLHYEFQAIITQNNNIGSSNFELQINLPPKSRNCSINPSSGKEYETIFDIKCNNYDSIPLTYLIFQNDHLLFSSKDNPLNLRLNKGSMITVEIRDVYGSSILIEIPVIVEPNLVDLDKSEVIYSSDVSSMIVLVNMLKDQNLIFKILDIIEINTDLRVFLVLDVLEKITEKMIFDHSLINKTSKIMIKIVDSFTKIFTEEVLYEDDFRKYSKKLLKLANHIISPEVIPVFNDQLIIPPNFNDLLSEDYPEYQDFDVNIIDVINSIYYGARSITCLINSLGIISSMRLEISEPIIQINTSEIYFNALISKDQTLFKGISSKIILDRKFISNFNESIIKVQITFFEKNPYWWFPSSEIINSDVIMISAVNHQNIEKLINPLEFFLDVRNVSINKYYGRSSKNDMPVYKIEMKIGSRMIIKFLSDKSIKIYVKFNDRPSLFEATENGMILNDNKTVIVDHQGNDQKSFIFLATFSENEFVFTIQTLVCNIWNDSIGDWDSRKCQIGSDSNDRTIHCHCYHLSAFSAKLFSPVIKLEKMRKYNFIERNYILTTLLIEMITVYLILMIIMIYKKKPKIYNCVEFKPDKYYYYLVTFKTGVWSDVRTTSNIKLKIYGSKGSTKLIELINNDPKYFRPNQESSFFIRNLSHLGYLFEIYLSLDCFGKNPPWFCDFVKIYDIQRKEEWIFLVDRWFSLTKSDGLTNRVCVLSSKESIVRSNLIKNLSNGFLWFRFNEIFKREKLTFIVITVLSTMTFNVIFLGKTYLENYEEEIEKFKSFSLGLKNLINILISGISSLVIAEIVKFMIYSRNTTKINFKRMYRIH